MPDTQYSPPPRAFTIDGMKRAFGISRSTVYQEIKNGYLRARKLCGRTVIDAEDAAAWYEARSAYHQPHQDGGVL